MVGFRFRLLGGLQIILDDKVITAIPGRKIKLLLAYLILGFDMPQSRRQIAFDFWPDSTEKQAQANLRKRIHDPRKCMPQIDRYLTIVGNTLTERHSSDLFAATGGNPNEAEKAYRQWLERNASSVSLRERSLCEVALGNCLRVLGKYEEF
ncbi:hypothetical protein ACI7RC_14930 [Brevibacillus sp. B_LB10_24]|uniref:AfsR/SARP family transcriptional regulator n=1 Tax=Brevibacillus sp. B_LB10_24 TaxID=3380645 RepID=UPI0038B9561A